MPSPTLVCEWLALRQWHARGWECTYCVRLGDAGGELVYDQYARQTGDKETDPMISLANTVSKLHNCTIWISHA